MVSPVFNGSFDKLKGFPEGREWWEKRPHQQPLSKNKSIHQPLGETITKCY